jgi:hypothetical protein
MREIWWLQENELVEGVAKQSDGKNNWTFDWGTLQEYGGNP